MAARGLSEKMIQEAQALKGVSRHGDIPFQILRDNVRVEFLGLADDDVKKVGATRVRGTPLLNVKINSEFQLTREFSQRPITPWSVRN